MLVWTFQVFSMRQEKFTVSLPSHWITSICVFSHLYFTHCFRSVLRLAIPFTSPTLEVYVRIVFRRFCAHRNERYLRNDGTPFTWTLTILIKIYKNPFTFQLWMRSLIINIMNFMFCTQRQTQTHAHRAWFIINWKLFFSFFSWRLKNQFELQLNLIAQ